MMETLHKLQEERIKTKAKAKISLHQNRIKRWFDRNSAESISFSVGVLVLKWNKAHKDKGKHANL